MKGGAVKGERNIGAMRAESVSQELAEMARELLEHPGATLRRSALVHAVADLMDNNQEQEILGAIAAAGNLATARLLRDAAESMSESVCRIERGSDICSRLFTVALVVRYPETVCEEDFEESLAAVSWPAALQSGWRDCGGRGRLVFVQPFRYRFEDLAGLRYRAVRRVTLAATSQQTGHGSVGVPGFPSVPRPQRRSTVFLRYLVGHELDPGSLTQAGYGEMSALCRCIDEWVRTSAVGAQEITTIMNGRFFGAVYQGLRVYHAHRLAEIAEKLRTECKGRGEVAAWVSLSGSRQETEAHLSFSCDGEPIGHHTYSMRVKPFEDAKKCVQRIARDLRRAGIREVTTSAELITAEEPKHTSRSLPSSIGGYNRTRIVIPL